MNFWLATVYHYVDRLMLTVAFVSDVGLMCLSVVGHRIVLVPVKTYTLLGIEVCPRTERFRGTIFP